jgi:hypothetical protein
MERKGDEIHVSEEEARSGETPHIARYVLGVGLLLAIIALSIIWMSGAFSTRQAPAVPAVTNGGEAAHAVGQ